MVELKIYAPCLWTVLPSRSLLVPTRYTNIKQNQVNCSTIFVFSQNYNDLKYSEFLVECVNNFLRGLSMECAIETIGIYFSEHGN